MSCFGFPLVAPLPHLTVLALRIRHRHRPSVAERVARDAGPLHVVLCPAL